MSEKNQIQVNQVFPKKFVKYHLFKNLFYAYSGLKYAFYQEKNLSIQLSIGVFFAVLGIFYGRWITAMANLVLMSLVMSLEMINTAIENLCDIVNPGYSVKIKIIKDIAAGSVLFVALVWFLIIIYELVVIFLFQNVSIEIKI